MKKRVALLPGDGVGPEVIAEARRVVDALGLQLEWTELAWGTAWYHEHGSMMPDDALALRADECDGDLHQRVARLLRGPLRAQHLAGL